MNRDMTTGNPAKILVRFSLPLLGSVMFQQLYNIADSVIAGKCSAAGEDAVGAIGASYPITMIFMAIAFGINIGSSVVVSNLFGAKRIDKLKTAVSTTFYATLALVIVLTLLGQLLGRTVLSAVDTPQNILEDAALYLNIYVWGLLFLFFYNICNGIFTALGDSATPLFFLIGSSLSNIGLDLLFVAVLHWDVAGVAWATFLTQGCAAILSFTVLLFRLKKMPCGKYEKFSFSMLGSITKISLPSVLQQLFVSVGNLFVQSLVNGFGSAATAGFSAAMKLNTTGTTAITSVASGISSFTAQNVGAHKLDRIRKGFWASAALSAGVVVILTTAYLLFPDVLMQAFFTGDSAGAEVGKRFLTIISPFYVTVAAKITCDGVLRGSGRMHLFMITTFADLALRVFFAFFFVKGLGTGSDGIWWSWPVGWCISSVMSIFMYFSGMWKPKKELVN